MKSITEILGGAQILLAVSFELQDSFEEYLNEEQRSFLALLRVFEASLPYDEIHQLRGRPAYQARPFIRAFLAMSFFRIPTMENLRRRLEADPNLRMLCGFTHVPSLATFSRRLSGYSNSTILSDLLDDIIHTYVTGKRIEYICRDSTAIAARETAINTKSGIKPEVKKRGRPRKDEVRPEKKQTNIEKQITQESDKSLSDMNKSCAWGVKKNSQGNMSYWKGYKLHLDVTDLGIPVTALVTGANVHDSQLAIPMEQITGKKISWQYSLMDAGYDADTIISFIKSQSRLPLIDQNKRRKQRRPDFTDNEKKRYAVRSTVERANAFLKDWLIPERICFRGYKKVSFFLMCAVVNLAAIKVLQYYILPELQIAA